MCHKIRCDGVQPLTAAACSTHALARRRSAFNSSSMQQPIPGYFFFFTVLQYTALL